MTRGRVLLLVSSAGLAVAIFLIDLRLPSEIASSAAYAVPLLLASRQEGPRRIVLLGTLATLLTGAGFAFTQATAAATIVLGNRFLSLVAIWSTVVLAARAAHEKDRMQSDMQQLNAMLETQAERLREIGRALRNAERLAEVGRKAGTVAHELRNPLGVIATSLALLEARHPNPDTQTSGALSRAKRAIDRCERIVTEHLNSARATGHRPQAVVLDKWLSTTLDEMRLPENIALVRDLRAGQAVVHIDPESFRRAIINVVDNACQAMAGNRAGGRATRGVLSVTSADDGEGVLIAVSDNGPGIPADLLSRLPEPLFSTKKSGTGLGLSTVQQIVQDHSGSLRIDSEPDVGTTVTMRLPLAGQG